MNNQSLARTCAEERRAPLTSSVLLCIKAAHITAYYNRATHDRVPVQFYLVCASSQAILPNNAQSGFLVRGSKLHIKDALRVLSLSLKDNTLYLPI